MNLAYAAESKLLLMSVATGHLHLCLFLPQSLTRTLAIMQRFDFRRLSSKV